MAYDQGYYPPHPPRGGYGGRGGGGGGGPLRGPPPPHAGYGHQQQPYPPNNQYEQYGPDSYGYDYGQGNGYVDDYRGYGDMGNGPPRGNGYPPQPRPPQFYDGRGGPSGRGGRPPPPDGYRGYGPGPGPGPRGGGPHRGGYPPRQASRPPPPPMDRDPYHRPRVPMKSAPTSPQNPAWDNPFPTFPGAKKKTSMSEEQEIIRKMTGMDMNHNGRDMNSNGRPRTAGSKGSGGYAEATDDYGYPTKGPDIGNDVYLSSPVDNRDTGRQEGGYAAARGPVPPQRSPQRGAQPPNGFAPPTRQNTYAGDPGYGQPQEVFAPPPRSMTMPTQSAPNFANTPMMNGPVRQTPVMNDPLGPSAPYNGPIGRGPPRPATASGSRPIPHRTYPNPNPPPQQSPPRNGAGMSSGPGPKMDANGYLQKTDSVLDFYDQYYDGRASQSAGPSQAPFSDFETAKDAGQRRRGNSIDGHVQNAPATGGPFHAYGFGGPQPQTAVIDHVRGPSAEDFRSPKTLDPYGQPIQPYGFAQGPQHSPSPHGYGQPAQNTPSPHSTPAAMAPHASPPPRSMSVATASTTQPDPSQGYGAPRAHSVPQTTADNPDHLPAHPVPVRPGLNQNQPAQTNNKPPPVRNYDSAGAAKPSPTAPTKIQQAEPAKPLPPTVTTQELELLRSKAKNMSGDQSVQLEYAKKLVEAAETLAARITEAKARHKAREKYTSEAHKILKKLIAVQHTEAMFFTADCYGRGALGLEADTKEAFTLYQNAAKAGHSAAAYRTAVCCELGAEEGGGTRKDPVKAIQWYRRAATLGDVPAMYKMGMIQLKGLLGQPKVPHEAVVWLKRAADHADGENPHALHELALLYESPHTAESPIQRDERYAFELFNHAANLGYKFSQFRLGAAFEYGLFDQQIDPRQSIMWYSKAAVQEEHQSEMALSGWYLTGADGILQQSDTEAYLWARKAALAGLAKAEYAMGYFTEMGIGAPANLDDAKRWYWRAAAQNFPKAREKLEDLKKGGGKMQPGRRREHISRSQVGKHNEGECTVM